MKTRVVLLTHPKMTNNRFFKILGFITNLFIFSQFISLFLAYS